MTVSLNLIAAACSSRGIGINGRLPWKLRLESWRETRVRQYHPGVMLLSSGNAGDAGDAGDSRQRQWSGRLR